MKEKTRQSLTQTRQQSAEKKAVSSSHITNQQNNWVWPAQGKVSKNFSSKTHTALEISGKSDEPIWAAETGRVVYTGFLKDYGNAVLIQQHDQLLTVYGNNQKILVQEGQWVKAGQQIATMGTNNSKKSYLHFEVRKQGTPIDPSKFFTGVQSPTGLKK